MNVFSFVRSGWSVWALAGMLSLAVPVQADEAQTVEVLPHIRTVVPASPDDGNSTFIVTDEGVMVIDTRLTVAGGRHVLETIRAHTDRPVVYVINTHGHEENMVGNLAFEETRTVIAQEVTQKNLLARMENEKLNIRPPNLVFETGMEVILGGYRLRLIHPGPAHTRGDLYVYLPSWRTIIAGGMVFNGIIPDLSDGFLDLWIKALREMEDLDAELIVPGHGEPGGKPLVTQMKHYLMQLRTWVTDCLDQDKGLRATIEQVRPLLQQRYGHWQHQDRIDANIQRAFIELSAKKGA